MATLPLELIDKIFLINPNKIISTYLAFSNANATSAAADGNSDADNKKKRKLNNSSKKNIDRDIDRDIDGDKYTIKYLLNKDTYMKYYRQSSWLKYFIPSHSHSNQHPHTNHLRKQSKQNKTNTTRIRHHTTPNLNSVIEPIKLIANYFNLLETYYKKQPRMEGNDGCDTRALITSFETILDTSEFSNEKYEKQLEAIKKYYVYTSEIPAFVKLIVILYNCGYFAASSKGISKPGIHIFLEMVLEMVLEGDSEKITDFTKTYKYYSAIYKFIPLFNIYLGMGYSFVIGWDTLFDCLIGLTENGSDGNEVMYNIQRSMKYFIQTPRLVSIDKKQLLKDYLEMIGITDTSILLDYSRRLDICDMPIL